MSAGQSKPNTLSNFPTQAISKVPVQPSPVPLQPMLLVVITTTIEPSVEQPSEPIQITEYNILQELRSILQSKRSGAGGSSELSKKAAEHKLVKRVFLEFEHNKYGTRRIQLGPLEEFRHILENQLPPSILVWPNVEHLVLNYDDLCGLNLWDMELVEDFIRARNVCDRTSIRRLPWRFHLCPGNQVPLMGCKAGMPEVLTLHDVGVDTQLWRRPGKITRIVYNLTTKLDPKMDRGVIRWISKLGRMIRFVETSDAYRSADGRGGPKGGIKWEIYLGGLDAFKHLFSLRTPGTWLDTRDFITAETLDKRIASCIEEYIKREVPQVKDRLKVFTFAQTRAATCACCGQSMDFSAPKKPSMRKR